MNRPHAVILSGGGLASLVAGALAQKNASPSSLRLTLLHIDDGRENAGLRLRYAKAQAQSLIDARVHRVEAQHLVAKAVGLDGSRYPDAPLRWSQLLLAAAGHALGHDADRVIWPVAHAADVERSVRVTSTTLLIDGLSRLEAPKPPAIETPLSELTPVQVIRLGEHLKVDWTLAWSCLRRGRTPCSACEGCRKRSESFQAAGLPDPLKSADAVLSGFAEAR
ncbi:MAG: 7-cyano-7-deazaguanine synthase [Phycisphaeraceae bacterium]